jgi:hypothetical protein
MGRFARALVCALVPITADLLGLAEPLVVDDETQPGVLSTTEKEPTNNEEPTRR